MMKNIKRIVKISFAFVLAVILSLAVFGCNYKAETGILPSDYEPDPRGKIRLQYYIASTEADKRSCNDWVAAFNKHYPNVTVQADLSNVGKATIQAQIASKSVGDVFFLWETDVYNYASKQKVLMQLDYYVEAYDIDLSNVFGAIQDMGCVEGKLYMVMRDYNHIAMMYNRTMITEAGLDDPIKLERDNAWDWDTFKYYCEALTTTDETAEHQTVGAQMRLGYAPLYMAWLEMFGGKWYDSEQKKVYFNSDVNVLRAVEEMVDFVKTNTVRYSVVSGESILETASQKNFNSYDLYSDIAFFDSEFPNFASHGRSYEGKSIEWDVVSMPAYENHKVGVGATGFAVFNGTKNKDAAAALCLSLYTEDGQKAYNGQEGGSVPNVKTLANSSFWRVPWADKDIEDPDNIQDPETKNYYAWISFPEADTYGQVECVIPPEIAEIVSNYMCDIIPKAINGTRSVDSSLAELEQKANQKWEAIYAN